MKPDKRVTDRCRLPAVFWQALVDLDVAPAQVLKHAHLPLDIALDASSVITTTQLFAIWNAIESVSGDPAFSLRMVSETSTSRHKMAFLAASYASNYRDGLARVLRFKRLCSPDQICLNESYGELEITIAWPAGVAQEPPLSVDANFALLLELGRRGTGQHISPMALELRRSRPGTDKHAEYFGCPVCYGAERDMMILNTDHLELPFHDHNRELLDYLSPVLATAMQSIEEEASLADRIKSHLKRVMSQGMPDLSGMARELGLSERTLQRRMTAEGTTFRVLLTEARQEMSYQFLSDPAIEMKEIAYLLGYEDANSFYRAFREWKGMTPNDWRARQERIS